MSNGRMIDERGWTRRGEDYVLARLLEWIDVEGKDGTLPNLGEFMELGDIKMTADDLQGWVSTLRHRGLIYVHESMGGITLSSANPTDAGTQAVRAWRAARENRRDRVVACRDALLDWFYEEKRAGAHFPVTDHFRLDVRGHFFADPFTEREVTEAGEHLLELGLIKAVGSFGNRAVKANITAAGEEVVEDHASSLAAWRKAASQAGGGGTHFNTNFNGPVSGQVGIGRNVTQTQSQGIDPTTLLAILDDIREAMAAAEPPDQAYITTYINLIQVEATGPDPDRAAIAHGAGRLERVAAKVGNTALTSSVSALITYLATFLT